MGDTGEGAGTTGGGRRGVSSPAAQCYFFVVSELLPVAEPLALPAVSWLGLVEPAALPLVPLMSAPASRARGNVSLRRP
jgi:hypothetical protein